MSVRKIVKIDEVKCNGCGLCIPNCAEGALAIIDGKAKLVKDIYCDGLGACLGHCPQDAIEIIERDASEFNEAEAMQFVKSKKEVLSSHIIKHVESSNGGAVRQFSGTMAAPALGGCPGSKMRQINRSDEKGSDDKTTSKLSQWPIQLKLVPVDAPFFKGADLLITADCVPFAYANYHKDFLKGKSVVVGCPKLDDADYYLEKLSEIIKNSSLESITVLRMEVPCCGGMSFAAKGARDKAGSDVPVKVITISIEGKILKREYI